MTRLSFSVALLVLVVCAALDAAAAQQPTEAVRTQLASTGKLRVAFVIPNALVVRKDPASGEFRGMSIELGRDIAKRLGVGFEPVGYANVMELNQSTDANAWDIAVRSYEIGRAAVLDFTAPFMEVESTFLVPLGSPLNHVSEFDQPGIRLVLPRQSSPDLYFQKHPPKHATIERTAGPGPATEMLKAGQANAFAQNRELLIVSAQQIPGSRVLDGSFDTLAVALAVPKGRAAAVEYLNRLIDEWKASGFVKDAISRSGLVSAKVAPPAKPH